MRFETFHSTADTIGCSKVSASRESSLYSDAVPPQRVGVVVMSGLLAMPSKSPLRLLFCAGIMATVGAIVCVVAARSGQSPESVDTVTASSAYAPASTDLGAACETAMGQLGEVRERVGPAAARLESEETNASVAQPRDSLLWASAPRSDADLALLFLSGNYSASNLVRHVLLNPGDMPVDSVAFRDLEDFVARTLSAGRPFRERMRSLALSDREAVVRNSEERPAHVEITEEEMHARAKALAKQLSNSGRAVSVDEAKSLIESGHAFSVRLPRNTSFIDGKVYRNGDFRTLGNHDAAFDLLRQVAIEEASAIVGWFVANGLCSLGDELKACFARILEVSPRDLDR